MSPRAVAAVFVIAPAFAGALALSHPVQAGQDPTAPAPTTVTVVVDFVVEDARDRPVSDLKVQEIELRQDRVPQVVEALRPGAAPGHYQLRYVPRSGQAGPVTVQILRAGARVRGPEGPFLKPRIERGLSPLEHELSRAREARPDAHDLASRVAVLRFESATDGVHHLLALEVPLSELQFTREQGGLRGRLQLLARLLDGSGRPVHDYSLDRALEAASPNVLLAQRFVWTANIHLRPGRYRLETTLRDAKSGRSSADSVAFESEPPRAGLRLSSVGLIQPTPALLEQGQVDAQDDPLFLDGTALLPTFDLMLPAGVEAHVRFFVAIYPDAGKTDPVQLKAQLLRDGNMVGEAPVALPAQRERGPIRYSGAMPTRSFRPARYVLRLLAQQGDAVVTEETGFTVTAEPQVPRLKFGER